MDFEILEWDSQIFEIPTAVITNSIRDKEELERVVSEMRGAGIRLAYYFSPVQLGDFSEDYGGILVDRKITFHVGFGGSRPQPIEGKKLVVPFTQDIPTPEMESLAVQSGEHSRFAVDPKFPRDKFEKLYTVWINRSVRKEIADEVLVIQQEETIVGFVTIKSKDGVGEIGLIAVDVSQRRKQYGQRLVQGAMAWCRNQGLFGCCVITQGENKPAGRLYKKCGFEIQKTTYVYHFWI